MKHGRTSSKIIVGIAAFLILAGASRLLAQDERNGFYISAQTAFVSGLTFPASYSEGAPAGAYTTGLISLLTTTTLSSRAGLGLALGYRSGGEWLWIGGEIEYAAATAPDGTEVLQVPVLDNWGYTIGSTERSFTQSGRKASYVDISFLVGTYPFRSFDLGFNIAIGVGYGRHVFTSAAIADAESRGLDVKDMIGTYEFDFGNYDGGGTWTKGSFVYVLGLGTEFNFSRRLSLRIDYRYVGGFLTRDISEGVYFDGSSTVYQYTMGNKFTVGLNFHI